MSDKQNDKFYEAQHEAEQEQNYIRKKQTKTFIDFLMTIHSEQYYGLDDDMTDDFNDWLDGLDNQEIIDYADEWHKNDFKD